MVRRKKRVCLVGFRVGKERLKLVSSFVSLVLSGFVTSETDESNGGVRVKGGGGKGRWCSRVEASRCLAESE